MKKLPLVTIIGVPNTGKSTFFNRMVGKRKALVHPQPGMTRDIYKKSFFINDMQLNLQDSGGFFIDKDIITDEINRRVIREAKKSDLIIFLFDGKREILGYEKDLFLEIRKINDNIIPVLNKVDNPHLFICPSSYFALKIDFMHASSEHDLGIEGIKDKIYSFFKTRYNTGEMPREEPATRISIMGKPNVGKSSIINRILNEDQVIVSPLPGTTRDSVDIEINRNSKKLIIVDNAGIRKLQKVKEDTETAAVIRAGKDIVNSQLIIYVVDCSKKLDQNDLFIANKILKSAKPVIIAANKWDLAQQNHEPSYIIRRIRQRLNDFYFAPIILVSAKTGKNIFQLLDQSETIHDFLNNSISTSRLNRALQQIYQEKKLLTKENHIFKSKFASVESTRPFFIKIFAKSPIRLKNSDEIFLKKRIQEELSLNGVPVFLKIVASQKK